LNDEDFITSPEDKKKPFFKEATLNEEEKEFFRFISMPFKLKWKKMAGLNILKLKV
jgi:hypothetical protein